MNYKNYFFIISFAIFSCSTTFCSLQEVLTHSFLPQSFNLSNLDLSKTYTSFIETASSLFSQLSLNLFNNRALQENKTTFAIVAGGIALSSCCFYLWNKNTVLEKENVAYKKDNAELTEDQNTISTELQQIMKRLNTLKEKVCLLSNNPNEITSMQITSLKSLCNESDF